MMNRRKEYFQRPIPFLELLHPSFSSDYNTFSSFLYLAKIKNNKPLTCEENKVV
jgi:hypothetical protein